MSLLIDGYNLLHVTGIVGGGAGPGTFERSRRALLNFLAAALAPDELPDTTVVFDAAGAPPGLPAEVEHEGLLVRFARGYPDADTLIEELIQSDFAPKRLTVVSSDHRIQRAARRRRATAVDSDRWYAQLVERRRARGGPQPVVDVKPAGPLSAAEVERWLDEFGPLPTDATDDDHGLPLPDEPPAQTPLDSAESPQGQGRKRPSPVREKREEKRKEKGPFPDDFGKGLEELREEKGDSSTNLANPFPPGYGEDVFEEEGE